MEETSIQSVLGKFSSVYADAYAAMIALTESTSDDLNPKMIGILTALASHEYHQADQLISEATSLCYRNAINAQWNSICSIIEAVKREHGEFPLSLQRRIQKIGENKRRLGTDRSNHIEYNNVFSECSTVYTSLLDEFQMNEERARAIKSRRSFESLYKWVSMLIGVVVGFFVAGYSVEIFGFIRWAFSWV